MKTFAVFRAHLSNTEAMTESTRTELARVARRYFLDGVSKVKIADELGVSRFKVARMIDEALDSGVVTITIHESGGVDAALSARLAEHLDLTSCAVVEGRTQIEQLRSDVGGAAAQLLTDVVREGDVLGVTWGRTLTAMTENLQDLPPITVVQLTGTVGSNLSDSPVEVIRRVSARARGDAHAIFSPLVFDDAATAQTIRRQPNIARAIVLFDDVDVAVLAIGSWDPPISQLRATLSEEDLEQLHAQGVIAEVAGILVTEDAKLLPDFADRCISISATQLARVPRKIAVAAEEEKAVAVHAVVRTGLITDLVTDVRCAKALLDLPSVEHRN